MAQNGFDQEPPDLAPRTEAICARTYYKGLEINPDWWHETGTRGGNTAIDLCYQCPIMLQCAEYAITHNEEWGIWGGMTADERRRLQKNRKRTSRKGMPRSKY